MQTIVEKLREINSSTPSPKTRVEKKWGKYPSDKGVSKKPEVSLSETEKPHFLEPEQANDRKLVFDEDKTIFTND